MVPTLALGQGCSIGAGGVMRTLPAHAIRSNVIICSVRCVDTRQSLVIPITKEQLFCSDPNDDNSWNGLCEDFFRAGYLGVYARDIPNKVEIKFGLGGLEIWRLQLDFRLPGDVYCKMPKSSRLHYNDFT